MKLIGKDLRLKPLKEGNELSAFVNTVYDNFFHEIANLEDALKNENDPLHYLLLKTRLDDARNALKMYESVVDNATEYVAVGIEVIKNE